MGFRRHLVVLLSVAGILRVCNLGTFSLWLDEILLVLRSRGTLTETWEACAAHGEHPPLSALVMAMLYGLGASDDLQRLVPILLGLGSIALLVVWARNHFGTVAGLAAGWLAALSPYHLRYSQELRPYAYVLFFALLTLVLSERVLARPSPVKVVACAAAAAAGLYSHNLFILIVVPIASVAMTRRVAGCGAKGLLGLVASAALALALYLPWLGRVVELARRTAEPSAQTWWYGFFTRLWQFLTVAGREGEDLTWGGALMLVLVLAGLGVAAPRWRDGGLAVVAGAVVGVAGVEAFYHLVIRRWSVGRYDIMGWPFLVVAAALALDLMLRRRGRRRYLGAAVALALGVAHMGGVLDYQVRGREQWHRMAEVVRRVRVPGEPILTENIFCHYGLTYYLCGPEALRGDLPPDAPIPIDRDLERLRRTWPDDRSCLLVRGGTPLSPEVRRVASYFPVIAAYADSSWLHRLPGQSRVHWGEGARVRLQPLAAGQPWPPPSTALLPDSLLDPRRSCLGRLRDLLLRSRPVEETHVLEFDPASTAGALLAGWSGFETSPDGTTFAWVTGLEACLVFGCAAPRPMRLSVTLWPFAVPGQVQRVRGFVNQHLLGEVVLRQGRQTVEVKVPRDALRGGHNLLVLQFAYALAPANVKAGARDWRPLACAVDRVELIDEICAR